MLTPCMKYLGLTLDRAWNFTEHFKLLIPRIQGAAGSLARLLPNIGRPRGLCRRLFTGIIRSMALYGAPVWADSLSIAKNRSLLRKPQRIMAIRTIRGYRTISHGAACAIAGSLPWEKEAVLLADAYHRRIEERAQDLRLAPQEARYAVEQAREVALESWADDMESATYGRWTLDAIRLKLKEWVHRQHGTLTFRLVQILSGHGCFGQYLHRVARRERSPACHHCGAAEDTAQHTLQECSAWAVQRLTLEAVVGQDLSLPSVIEAMLGNDSSWEAMVSFCEEVILQKETAERVREADPQADPLRRRRTGRRRRLFHQLLPLDGGLQGLGAGSSSPALHRPLTPRAVQHDLRHPPSPQGDDRGVRLRRTITDRAAEDSYRVPVTLSSADAASNDSSGDEWFDDALALR